ncbi:MAG: LCP family protein [Chloroflexi bacterium]|nr:LCP family protein [Chloroflexota bacterium]
MKTQHIPSTRRPARHTSPLWSGLLLGLLLTLFLVAFVYVAYLFLSWGQVTAAQLPKLPPLSLPKLVRSAPSANAPESNPLSLLFQPAAQRGQEASSPVTGRVTVLLMGVDNRPDETIARTDSILVLTVNPKTGTAGILSLPRDLLVTIPGTGERVKINTVHFIGERDKVPGGGPALLRTTVSQLIGYPVDYYVRLNFEGFQQIIDQLGGVDIDVPKTIDDPLYPDENYGYDPLHIPAGRQHMDGKLALKYARTRHVDSDYGRAARQQQVIVAIKDKVMQPGQLASLLPRLPGLTVATANSIQTDMPIEKAIALARAVGQMDLQNPARIVVDNTMGTEVPEDPTLGFILVPDMAKLRAATAAVFADAPAGPTAAEAAAKAIQAEGARIVVLNGTTEAGLAAKAEAALQAAGFTVAAVGNADRADYAQTVLITHGDRTPATREALVRRYNIPPDRVRSEPSADGKDLTVILGADQVTR